MKITLRFYASTHLRIYASTLLILLLAMSSLAAQQKRVLVNRDWKIETAPTTKTTWSKSVTTSQQDLITVGHSIVSSQQTRIYAQKVSLTGQTLWSTTYQYEGNPYNYGVDVSLDENDNLYIIGMTAQAWQEQAVDAVVIKITANGLLQWERLF